MSKCQFEIILELTAGGEYNGREVTFAARPVQELVRCAECRWRPEYGTDHNGKISHSPEHLKFPMDENMEYVCPCSIDDWYYSWMPADDFFCKKGERKKDASNEPIK